MEGMESVGEAVLADVLLVGGEVLAIAVHVGQDVHVVVLEHFIQLPQIGPPLVVEVAVADGGTDNDAVVLHDPLVANNLRGQGLHHLDGVGAHAVAVVEVLGHTEDHDIVLFLGEGDISTLVGTFPGNGLHDLGIAGENGNLAGVGVQHRVAAEEGMAHLGFHVLTDFVKFGAHQAVTGHGGEVTAVHDLGHMVRSDAAPVGDAGGAVLVAAGVAAVGVALGVADEDGDVAVEDVLVHEHRVAPAGGAQIHHVIVVLTVVGGDLVGIVELVKQLLPQNLLHLGNGGPGVQTIGEHEQNVLLAYAAGVQLVQAGPDSHLPVGGGLTAALDDVGNDEDHGFAGGRQLPQSGHSVGVADGLQSGVVQAVPVLRQAFRVGHGLAGDEHIGVVGQVGGHQAVAVFKIQFHMYFSLLSKIGADDFQVFLGVEADFAGEPGQGNETAVNFRDRCQHFGVVHLQAAAVDHIDAAGDFLDKPGNLGDVVLARRGLAGADGPDGLIADDHLALVHAVQTDFQLLPQNLVPAVQLRVLFTDAVQHGHAVFHRQLDFLIEEPVDGLGVGDTGFRQNAHLVVALFAVTNDGGVHAAGQHGGHGAVGGESAEVAAHSSVHPVDALAAHLHGAVFTPGSRRAQNVGLGEILDKLHFAGIVGFQSFLRVLYDVAAPLVQGRDAVDAAVGYGHVKALQVQKNMLHIQIPAFL